MNRAYAIGQARARKRWCLTVDGITGESLGLTRDLLSLAWLINAVAAEWIIMRRAKRRADARRRRDRVVRRASYERVS